MYSDLDNQLFNIGRYVFAFSLVYVFWPLILFKGQRESGLEGYISRYAKMVCLTIALVYILVIIQLYEVLSLVAILLVLSVVGILMAGEEKKSPRELWDKMLIVIYDFFDGLVNPLKNVAEWLSGQISSLKAAFCYRFGSVEVLGNTILFAVVFSFAAYLRFYDAVMHAAPAMSDAYVTLAWMKYIEKKILFYDGVYPQGFHMYLSVLHKFATNDPLYILKYTGPLNGLLTALGIYFVVSRFTGRKVPGIIAAFVFGVLGSYLPLSWERQVSTNSQEFATVFLLPAWYFAHSYMKTFKRSYLWTAGACFAVIGWVHSLIFMLLGVGLCFLLISNLLLNFKVSLRATWHICLAGALAGVLAVLPMLFGLLMGKKFHASSSEYLSQKLQIGFPDINMIDQMALAGLLLFFIFSLITRKSRQDMIIPLFVILLGVSSFAMYMLLGPLTGIAIFAQDRIGILWSLLAPVGIGLFWSVVFYIFARSGWKQVAEAVICLGLMAYTVFSLGPSPVQAYKMQYDSMVEQYLLISQEFRPTQWMIVSSEEEYPLALGKGYHLMLGDFIKWYNPEDSRLAREVDSRIEVMSTEDIFIFEEKKILEVKVSGAEEVLMERYQRRAEEYQKLASWVEKFKAANGNLSIYYEDSDVRVYRIHQPKSREEKFKEIWGK